MGGGGFSMEPENLALDRYVLSQARAADPIVCFVPTASGDSDYYVRRFYDSYSRLGCRPRCLSLYNLPTRDLRSYLGECDVVYVGGGNTRLLLLIWNELGLPDLLRQALREGTILAGISAGANCWFQGSVTDSMGAVEDAWDGRLEALAGLGFLSGSFCPHYDGEQHRRPEFHRLVKEGALPGGWAADDGCALHFVDRALDKVVTSRPEARAYRVELRDAAVEETPREARLLERVRV
ncbi:MAG TPA: peptidase E [Thermoanaerobaculia bacterium]|nr:peptidase E [Thermoanaerobaculia bacterium]